MNHFFEAITNTSGDSLPGYFGRAINTTTQATVPIYADKNGTPIISVSGVANMAKTDEFGNLSFYVDPGTYHLDIFAPDAVTFLYRVSDVAMNATQGDKGDQGDTGLTGPANSSYETITAMRDGAIGNLSAIVSDPSSGGLFTWTLGDFTGMDDGFSIVGSNEAALSVGAWIRQDADKVAYDDVTVANFLSRAVRLGEDVEVTGNVTLGLDAFARIHHVTATATLTFPNPGSSLNGGIIIVRPSDICTGLVTLSGPFVYGASTIILWAGEQIELEWYASGGYYRIRTYQKRLMGGKISNETGNILMTDGVYVDFPVNTPSADRGAFDLGLAATPFYFDVANSRLKIPRTGQYHIEAICSISPAAACVGTLTLCKNGEAQNLDAMTEQQFTTTGRRTITCTFETFLNTGDYIIPRLKPTGAAGTVDNAVNGFVTIQEVK